MDRNRTRSITDFPLAAHGFTSYRAKGRFGWIMIGAKDHADAINEARRSYTQVEAKDLQVWNGVEYVDAFPSTSAEARTHHAERIRAALLAYATERSGAPKDGAHKIAETLAGFPTDALLDIARVIDAA